MKDSHLTWKKSAEILSEFSVKQQGREQSPTFSSGEYTGAGTTPQESSELGTSD